jgi:hypothetical protein
VYYDYLGEAYYYDPDTTVPPTPVQSMRGREGKSEREGEKDKDEKRERDSHIDRERV